VLFYWSGFLPYQQMFISKFSVRTRNCKFENYSKKGLVPLPLHLSNSARAERFFNKKNSNIKIVEVKNGHFLLLTTSIVGFIQASKDERIRTNTLKKHLMSLCSLT
jgi:hypothetical protein